MATLYAWPAKKKYPLDYRWQVHAAIAHFDANRAGYPARTRVGIARAIAKRAHELGIDTPSLKEGDKVAKKHAEQRRRRRRGPNPKGATPPQLRPYLFKKGHGHHEKGRTRRRRAE